MPKRFGRCREFTRRYQALACLALLPSGERQRAQEALESDAGRREPTTALVNDHEHQQAANH